MKKQNKRLTYFYIYTSKQFNYQDWKKTRKIIETKFKLKCQSHYLGSNDYYYGNFITFSLDKVDKIRNLVKEKKLRVAVEVEES